jgi:hypothetical protein
MWYLYTMEFYSAMKKNEILALASKWMELENIILSKVSQAWVSEILSQKRKNEKKQGRKDKQMRGINPRYSVGVPL